MLPKHWYNRKREGSRRRHAAAGTISAAWRRKNRRKTTLANRTIKANRKNIARINRNTETKMIETVQATVANRYSGQYLDPTQVDINGEDPGGASLVMRPLHGVLAGNNAQQRNGDKIKMTSLTYRVEFTATTGLLADTHNRCGMIVVRDNSPAATTVPPNLRGAAGTGAINAGTLLTGESTFPFQNFQNLETCGAEGRFKVLKHHKCLIQPVAAMSVRAPTAVINGTLRLPYTLRYDAAGAPVNQQLLFFFYSSSAIAPAPHVSAYCRFRYKDL